MKTKITFFAVLIAISFVSKAQTNVSGGIYSNTTWTLANSPYIVIDTVVVFPGYTLTIQPGVIVKFDNNMRLEIRQAKLIALGTSTDSITFTSNSLSPTTGIWGGIWLNGGLYNSKFNYCNFRYADFAINAESYGANVTFTNSKFNYNNYCVYSNSNNPGVSLKVDSCDFNSNTTGVYCQSGEIYMNYCGFNTNVKGVNCYFGTIHIDNCNVKNNFIGVNSTNWTYMNIEGCDISNNQTGVNIALGAGYFKIINCIIDSNSIEGIVIGNYNGGSEDDTVINCEIKYNGIGLYSGWGNSYISKNIIESNNIGIKVESSDYNIFCNKICNNTTYDFKYIVANGSNYTIANNYWCTTDSSIISTKIYDGYDNVNLALVSFLPIDTSQCYLNGCNLALTAQVNNSTCDTCHSGSATAYVTNGFAPYIYTWYTSPIQTTQTAIGLATGTYTVCVTDVNGCNVCINNVFVDSTNCNGFAITTSATNATCSTCNDGSTLVTATGGTSPYQYTWYTSPMQSTSIATGLSHGTYNVCVTDAYGCSTCDSVTILTGNCSAHFNLYPDSLPHNYLAINMASGAQPLTYTWDWGDGNNSNTPYPNHTYSSPGFYTICLTITDAVGCTNTYCTSYYLQKSANSMVNISVIPSIINKITENTKEETMLISPNPACDYINLKVNNIDPTSEVKIFNLLGEIKYFSILRGKNDVINISDLSSGIYLIEVARGNNISRQKFVKQ